MIHRNHLIILRLLIVLSLSSTIVVVHSFIPLRRHPHSPRTIIAKNGPQQQQQQLFYVSPIIPPIHYRQEQQQQQRYRLRQINLLPTNNNNNNNNNDKSFNHHPLQRLLSFRRRQKTQQQPSSSSSITNLSSSSSSSSEAATTQKRQLTREFVTIALPALVQLAAEPLAGLVDTAYLGRLGPDVLGGAGVAISAQYAIAKLYNDPLLRTSISLVAAQDGKARSSSDDATPNLSVAVSSALLLAFTVGLIQLVIYSLLCTQIIRGMGVNGPSHSMWYSAVSYLRIRALGTPAATLWLVTNGIFRGLGDTRTPLIYSLLFTALNAILDPLFIFNLNFGASGAAAGTAIAQYIALVPLLRELNKKTTIDIRGQLSQLGEGMKEYLRAGGLVLTRTVGKVLAYSVCAREAALLGPIAAAAYNLTFQLGFATTQICESIAIAVQTLLARELADANNNVSTTTPQQPRRQSSAAAVRHLITLSITAGGIIATSLSLLTYLQRSSLLKGLTTSLPIRSACESIFPVVLITQVLKGLAYPVNGIVMGGLDWTFSMVAMWVANVLCVGLVGYWGRMGGGVTLERIWVALAFFMGSQVVTGLWRVGSGRGVWRVLRRGGGKEDEGVVVV